MASQEEETRKIPLKVLIDKQNNKVVAVETTKDFVDTLFSFLSLPLATIIRLIKTTNNNNNGDQSSESETNSESESPVLGNINNLYQSVENLNQDDVWYPVCKQMLLHPRNPCGALCKKLYLNVDNEVTETKVFVCDSCNKFTQFPNLLCTCGKPPNRQPRNLDSDVQGNTGVEGSSDGVFVKEKGSMFLVFDDLKIVPSSLLTSMKLLMELGYSDWSQLETQTHNIGKQEILKLLKYTLTSHEPLTKTILRNSSKKSNPPNMFVDAVRVKASTSDIKIDVKLVRSKSHKKIIYAEANEDFIDFMFSFLCIPLGSILKLLDGNSFIGCVDNLYKSVQTLDSLWCTDSRSVLLNISVAPQYGCRKQLLDILDVGLPTYYYGTGRLETYKDYNGYQRTREVTIEGGGISKSQGLIIKARTLSVLDPRSPNKSKEGVVGFVKRPALYAVTDNLTVTSLSTSSCLFYLKELNHPLDDLEVKVVSVGGAEALSLLQASLTSKFTLTSGLEDFFNVPKQESNLTSKYTHTSRLNDLSKEPEPEAA